MPTVPGSIRQQMATGYDEQRVTPESVLMTAADMHARGQLTQGPTSYSDPRASLKLPGYHGQRSSKASSKRR